MHGMQWYWSGASMTPFPEWLPPDAWQGYVDMRKKIRKPLTDRAIALAISTLDKLRAEGYEPGAVLDQSVLNGWQGLFAIREERRNTTPQGQQQRAKFAALSKQGQATANNLQDWLEEA